jgi:hypothetical protein
MEQKHELSPSLISSPNAQSSSVIPRLCIPDFENRMRYWLGALGAEKFVTWMCDSLAVRLLNPDFDERLRYWMDELGAELFVKFMCNSLAARLGDEDFDERLHVLCCWTERGFED